MDPRFKKLIFIMIALVGLYISAYVAFRAAGYYHWKQMSITSRYRPSDKRFTVVYNYDLISVTAPWRGLVHSIKPVFWPLSKIEYVFFIRGGSSKSVQGLEDPRPNQQNHIPP